MAMRTLGQGLKAGDGHAALGGDTYRRLCRRSSCSPADSLGGLEVPMDDLVQVQVVHAADVPMDQSTSREGVTGGRPAALYSWPWAQNSMRMQ